VTVQDVLKQGYWVSVYREPDSARRYFVTYVAKGMMQARGYDGEFKPVPKFVANVEVGDDGIAVNWEQDPSNASTPREVFDQDVWLRVETLREWNARLEPLVAEVRAWAEELGWSTRLVEKNPGRS